MRTSSFVSAAVLSVAVLGSMLVPPAAAKKPPKPPPPPPPPPSLSTWSTYIKSYGDVIGGAKCDLTPEVVRATPDGGSIALALSSRPSALASESCSGASWVVKLDQYGNPQWQEMVGCLTPPASGGYAYGVSLERNADGGYVIGGGTVDCDSNPVCPYLTSVHCGLIERLDATGRLVWARVYSSSPTETTFNNVKPTSDGGFVAVGTFRDPEGNVGGLILKLDGAGNAQWQRKIGPGGPSGTGRMHVFFNAVQPTVEGGYVAAGEVYSYARRSEGDGIVLVVKVDASGNVAWQRGFDSFDAGGAPTASEHASSIIQTSEGGYLVAGAWNNTTTPGTCCQGPLLLKLDANGDSRWQRAYSGGVYCVSSYWFCYAIGGLAYSVHQTSDGGYAVAGAGDLTQADRVSQVPWLAKVDASGNLVWQYFYYQSSSQYFASSDVTSGGGHLALGFTTNPTDSAGELFAVKTDSAGLVGTCSQVHPATPLDAIDPGLAEIAPALPVQATTPAQGALPAATQPTSVTSTAGQC